MDFAVGDILPLRYDIVVWNIVKKG